MGGPVLIRCFWAACPPVVVDIQGREMLVNPLVLQYFIIIIFSKAVCLLWWTWSEALTGYRITALGEHCIGCGYACRAGGSGSDRTSRRLSWSSFGVATLQRCPCVCPSTTFLRWSVLSIENYHEGS